MAETQQSQPGADAAAELAEIRRRQQQVIKTTLVPVWYWWVMAAVLVPIGAARDSHDAVALAITIPLAVLVIAALVISTVPEVRRRVKIRNAAQPGGRGAAAIAGLIVLANVATIAVGASLTASRVPHPLAIGYAAGGAVLVIGGPLLNQYLGRLMLTNVRQPGADRPRPRDPWRGVLYSAPGNQALEHAESTRDGGTK
jgi:hypothetical protein